MAAWGGMDVARDIVWETTRVGFISVNTGIDHRGLVEKMNQNSLGQLAQLTICTEAVWGRNIGNFNDLISTLNVEISSRKYCCSDLCQGHS